MVETSDVIGGVSLGSNRSTRSAVNSIGSERSRRRFRNFMPCYRVDYDPRGRAAIFQCEPLNISIPVPLKKNWTIFVETDISRLDMSLPA